MHNKPVRCTTLKADNATWKPVEMKNAYRDKGKSFLFDQMLQARTETIPRKGE